MSFHVLIANSDSQDFRSMGCVNALGCGPLGDSDTSRSDVSDRDVSDRDVSGDGGIGGNDGGDATFRKGSSGWLQ